MYKLISTFFVLLFFSSCNTSTDDKGFQDIKEISIKISQDYANSYSIGTDFNEKIFAGYFMSKHSIDFFNLESMKEIGQIILPIDGPRPIQRGGGITLFDENIFYKSNSQIFKIAIEQQENANFPLSYNLNEDIFYHDKVYSNSPRGVQLILNDMPSIPKYHENLILGLHSAKFPFTFSGIYFLDQNFNETQLIPIEFEDELKNNLELFEGLNNPFICTNQKHIFIQFPFTSQIIRLDPGSGKHDVLNVPGKFIDGTIDKSKFVKGDLQVRPIRYSAQFWDIVWDPYREVFYRIEKEEHFDENGERINTRRGDHWINVISKEWEILGHFRLPNDHLARPYVGKDGIYFQRSNSDNETELRFAFYAELPI